MQNPFESGHIKNYLLLYASVVVIMILFFIASTLFNDVRDVEKKVFNTEINETLHMGEKEQKSKDKNSSKEFRLLDKAY